MQTDRLICRQCRKTYRVKDPQRLTDKSLPNCPRCKQALEAFDTSSNSPKFSPVEQPTPPPEIAVPLSAPTDASSKSSVLSPGLLILLVSGVVLIGGTTLLVSYWTKTIEKIAPNPPVTENAGKSKPGARKAAPLVFEDLETEPPTSANKPNGKANPRQVEPSVDDTLVDEEVFDASYEIIKKNLPSLSYRWQNGRRYRYQLAVRATIDSNDFDTATFCTLTAGPTWDELEGLKHAKNAPSITKDRPREVVETSGTGFVVSQDGYLITCAHVVENAQRIRVKLDSKSYRGKIVLLDLVHDLAVIKIDANDLQPLPLYASEKVELGQDVRAVGFPLSSVLGERLNITRGSVSGLLVEDEGEIIQVDAAINPGNSGGPLINTQGQVIGVAIAKLANVAISDVGFALPSSVVKELLERKKVDYSHAAPGRDLSGPELAKRVSPSVALLRVWIDSQPRESADLHYSLHQDKTLVASKGIGWTNAQADEVGRWGVSQYGADLGFEGEVRLPFAWECPPLLLTELLDPNGRSSWEHEEDVSFRLESKAERWDTEHLLADQGPFAGRSTFGSFQPPISGFPGDSTIDGPSYFNGQVRKQYEITSESDDRIEISKTVELVFRAPDATPTLKLTGRGQLVFDTQEGVPEQLAMRMQCHWKKNGFDKKFPVTVVYKRVEPSTLLDYEITTAKEYFADLLEKEREALKQAESSISQQIQQILQKIDRLIEEGDFDSGPINELKKMPVVESEREKVAETLLRYAQASLNSGEGGYALFVFARWGDNKYVPALLEMLKTTENFHIQDVTYVLGEFKDERAIEPMLEQLANMNDETFSRSAINGLAGALSKFGPSIEDKILPLLNHENNDIVEAACDILEDCGTKKSVEALTKLLASSSKKDRYRHDAEWTLSRLTRKDFQQKKRSNTSEAHQAMRSLADGSVNPAEKRLQEAIADLRTADKSRRGSQYASLQIIAETPLMTSYQNQVIPLLLKQLNNFKQPGNIKLAIRALAHWGDSRHAKTVENLLGVAKLKGTQQMIFNTLGKIGDKSTAKRMLPYLKSSNYGYLAVQAFGNSSMEVEDELIQLLSNRNIYLRARAAAALGYSSTKRAEDALLTFLEEEPDSLAREQAIYGVGRIRAASEQDAAEAVQQN